MMPLIEQYPRRRLRIASARGVDHHQSMIGDDQIGLAPRPFGALDEAAAEMRAAGVNTLPASVGQSGCPRPPEQTRQPARQVAADHVAVLAVRRPPPDQLGQDRRSPGERALHRVFQVEQAQIIFAPLAHHDSPRPLDRVGDQPRAFRIQLPLQRLGEGRHPHRSASSLGPQRRRREIGQGLADPGPRLGQQHVRLARRPSRSEDPRDRRRHRLLPFARFGPRASQLAETLDRITCANRHRARRGALGPFLPLFQPREQHPLGLFGPRDPRCDQPRPAPAQPVQRRIAGPRPLALGPMVAV